MDIYKLVGSFWEEDQRAHLSANATRLYFFLLNEANRKFWHGPLYLSWSYLQGALGMCRDSLSRAISDLKSRGLIVYGRKGKQAYFWFTLDRSVRQTPDQTENQTDNQTENQTINNKTIRQEYYKTKDKENISVPYGTGSTHKASYELSINPLLKSFKEEFPAAYSELNKTMQEIVDVWESVTGVPWRLAWIGRLREALAICYPSQIKQAITTLSRTQPGKLQEIGFPYLIPLLQKGAFGKRSKGGKKGGKDREDIELFRNPAGGNTYTDDELWDAVITSDKSKRSLRKMQE